MRMQADGFLNQCNDFYRRLHASTEHDAEGRRYVEHHRRRAFELFALVKELSVGARTLCEVGVGHYSAAWRELFPTLRITFVDRFEHARAAAETRGIEFFRVDLETATLRDTVKGKFDIVLCTEVLEHLLRSPREVLLDFSRCLAPGGHLVLSTPNFASLGAWRAMVFRRNPAAFPTNGNADAHHHVREYTMKELISFVPPGTRVVRAYHSDCWDRDRRPAVRWLCRLVPCLRSDLVIVLRKNPSA